MTDLDSRVPGNRHQTLAQRFWLHVVVTDGCWDWLGTRDYKGYGTLFDHGRKLRGPRVSWQIAHGSIPEGQQALHHCDNPPCCNPAHLYLGTNRDNVRDRWARNPGNVARGTRVNTAKLTDQDAREIRVRRAAGESRASLAAVYGVSFHTIKDVLRRRSWTHV